MSVDPAVLPDPGPLSGSVLSVDGRRRATARPGLALSDRADRLIRRISTVAVIVLSVAAAVLSYAGLSVLAVQADIDPRLSFLFPVVIDGLTLVGGLQVLYAVLTGVRSWYGWLLTLLGVSASVWGNVTASPNDVTSQLVHGTPPLVLALSLEAILRILRHRALIIEAQVEAAESVLVTPEQAQAEAQAAVDAAVAAERAAAAEREAAAQAERDQQAAQQAERDAARREIEQAQAETERARADAERAREQAERADADRLASLEQAERLAAEKAETERRAAEAAAQAERDLAERLAAEREAAERAAAEREAEQERAAAERLANARAEAARIAAERAEKAEQEKAAQAEAERAAQEKAERAAREASTDVDASTPEPVASAVADPVIPQVQDTAAQETGGEAATVETEPVPSGVSDRPSAYVLGVDPFAAPVNTTRPPAASVPVAAAPAATTSASPDGEDGEASGATARDRIKALLVAEPDLKGTEIARRLDLDKSYTYKVLKDLKAELATT